MVNYMSWLFLKILPIWVVLHMLSNKIKKELEIQI